MALTCFADVEIIPRVGMTLGTVGFSFVSVASAASVNLILHIINRGTGREMIGVDARRIIT